MKTLPSGMQAHLNTKATTLCWCWRLTRTDGTKLGFTDHDNDLSFDSTTFEADTGFSASEVEDQLGLAVSNLDVQGALNSSKLNEDDLAAGYFDNATVELWRVNWNDTTQRILMRKGALGEVRRGETMFSAEVRGLAHELQQNKGRSFQFQCDAAVGDSRCGINLELSTYKGTGTVASLSGTHIFTATGLGAYDDDWFTRGHVTWTSGSNNGLSMEVKLHTNDGSTVTVELWQPMSEAIAVSDTFEIRAGCNKASETCNDKFSNIVNFRGFPHMTGNDFITRYPNSDDSNLDGNSMQ